MGALDALFKAPSLLNFELSHDRFALTLNHIPKWSLCLIFNGDYMDLQ